MTTRDPDGRGLRAGAEAAGFEASLDDAVGGLLRTLVAAKPGGRILELGTGAGVGTGYLLAGADVDTRIVTVEIDAGLSRLASSQIVDGRVTWVIGDGAEWLEDQDRSTAAFDLVFADAWPGKFTHLDRALALLAPGGLYVVDDLDPQPNWPDGHQPRVDRLTATLESLPHLTTVRLDWASGVLIAARRRSLPERRP